MEEILKLYFSKKRIYILMHLTYLLLCVLITNKLLNLRGLFYSHPVKIDLPLIIDFVLSGQVLIPLISFLFIAVLFHQANILLNWIMFNAFSKRNIFKSVKKDFISMGKHFAWFREHNGRYRKGKNYEIFSAILQSFDDEELNILDFAQFLNTLILATALNLVFYHSDGVIKFSLSIITFGFYIFHVYNIRFLKILARHKDYFNLVKDLIEKNETTAPGLDLESMGEKMLAVGI